jgi:3'-phosphoadenosine 5'-phosphosulfate sulfotransferase (PAPS reductase)/FAD synthetase
MDTLHIVSFSGGKDSTAMLLHMIVTGMQVDEIIFCDTGVEFPQMYEHIDKVEQYIGRKITRLKWEHTYEYYLCDIPVKRRASRYKRLLARGEELKLNTTGYSFAGTRSRWCTRMKISAFNRHTKGKNLVRYIGIAADEPKRIGEFNYPLVEWGWTEADCLRYCYEHGFKWGGLYEKFTGNIRHGENLELIIAWTNWKRSSPGRTKGTKCRSSCVLSKRKSLE